MGSSASIAHENTVQTKRSRTYSCDTAIYSSMGVAISSCLHCPGFRLSQDKTNSFGNTLAICADSWKAISAQAYEVRGKTIKGQSVFVSAFFMELANLDHESEILTQLKSTRTTLHYERIVLMKMFYFLLSIKDDSFSVKAKIRSVGRRHASIGETDESIRIFNEAILRTLAVRLDPIYCTRNDVVQHWAILLQFIRVEMLIEKVDFHHCHSGKISSSRHNRRTLHSECSTNDDLDFSIIRSADNISGYAAPIVKRHPFGEPSAVLSQHSF